MYSRSVEQAATETEDQKRHEEIFRRGRVEDALGAPQKAG